MIIVKIQGGLGNQLFQYAIGRNLAYLNNTELKLDISFYKQNFKNCTPREYLLKNFNIIGTIATEEELNNIKINNVANKNIIQRINRKILRYFEEKKTISKRSYIRETYFNFCPEILKIKNTKNVYLYGNWQSEKYFIDIADIIRKELILKNNLSEISKNILIDIDSTNSTAIHIRRGDYVYNKNTNQYHGTCGLEYYHSAIKILLQTQKNPHFFIFSDDIKWVKNKLKINYPLTFISEYNLKDYEELVLMSKCRQNIIANSSFSWWAAWLNNHPNKLVIAPKKWFNFANKNTNDLIPKTWIKL